MTRVQTCALPIFEIALPDNTSNFDALYRMTDGDVPATAGLHELRDRYGADLVVLLRPYDSATHQGCGAAWISGYGGAPVEWSSDYGFAAVSDGSSNGKYCDDVAFAHEIGHNLGAMHDRANAGTAVGAYPFGFGYGVRGVFGTVMSYITPRIGRYSDPDASCSGTLVSTTTYPDKVSPKYTGAYFWSSRISPSGGIPCRT